MTEWTIDYKYQKYYNTVLMNRIKNFSMISFFDSGQD
jgi:hypothetical protein